MAVNLDQMATQAQQQGNQMLSDYQNKAGQYKGNYNNYSNQANAAQQGVSDYTKAMQGAYDASKGTGNAQSAYDYNLGQQENNVGYDKNAMMAASNNLNQAQGSLSAYNDFANTAASKWGLNAGGFAAANAGALGSINNNIASNQGVVSQLMDKYKTAQTGANSVVGLQQKGQEDTLAGLQNVYTNAANQRDQAASMMNFYDQLASSQGGLNAQQQQSYATAKAQIAAAQQAMAQAALLSQQYQQQAKLFADQQAQAAAKKAQAQAHTQATPPTPASSGFNFGNALHSAENFASSIPGRITGGTIGGIFGPTGHIIGENAGKISNAVEGLFR